MAYNCEIDSTKCRWSLWRVFLKAFPLGNETEIRKVVKAARDYYKQKLNEFQNPQKFEDPLSMRNEVISNKNKRTQKSYLLATSQGVKKYDA